MTVQTAYSTEHAVAYAGMAADLELLNTISKLNKGAATIPYGSGVFTDGEDGAALPTGAETEAQFNGVAMYEINRAMSDADIAAGLTGAPANRDYTVITHGVVWVTVLDTVAKDDDVFVRVGSTDPGEFSGIVGTGVTLGRQLTNAKFLTGGVAGELVKISLGLGG